MQRFLEAELIPSLERLAAGSNGGGGGGAAAVLVSHQTFADLLVQRLLDGDDTGWRYGAARYKFAHTATYVLVAEACEEAAGARALAGEGGGTERRANGPRRYRYSLDPNFFSSRS